MQLTKFDEATKQWVMIDSNDYPEVNMHKRIDTIEAFDIESNYLYKLEIFKDNYSEHA